MAKKCTLVATTHLNILWRLVHFASNLSDFDCGFICHKQPEYLVSNRKTASITWHRGCVIVFDTSKVPLADTSLLSIILLCIFFSHLLSVHSQIWSHSIFFLMPYSITGTHLVTFHCSNVKKSHLKITSKWINCSILTSDSLCRPASDWSLTLGPAMWN